MKKSLAALERRKVYSSDRETSWAGAVGRSEPAGFPALRPAPPFFHGRAARDQQASTWNAAVSQTFAALRREDEKIEATNECTQSRALSPC